MTDRYVVMTDMGDVPIEADEWERQSDGSRTFYTHTDDGTELVAEFDRENFVAVRKEVSEE